MNTIARKFSLFLGTLLICSSCFAAGSLVGKDAPQITIREWVTQNPPDIAKLVDHVYVVEFWATWCAPCRESIPHLRELTDKYRDKGLVFIGLSQDKSTDLVRKFVAEKNINYNVAIDNGTSDWFGIRGYPTVLVVNHKGKVAWQGYPWDKKFEQAILKAVSEGPPPMLLGVELGTFSKYRDALCGGQDFAKAYNQIREYADRQDSSANCVTARQIISTIDKRIADRTNQAGQLSSKDLAGAYEIYRELATKYSGIAATEPAGKVFAKLEKDGLNGRLVAKEIEKTPIE